MSVEFDIQFVLVSVIMFGYVCGHVLLGRNSFKQCEKCYIIPCKCVITEDV